MGGGGGVFFILIQIRVETKIPLIFYENVKDKKNTLQIFYVKSNFFILKKKLTKLLFHELREFPVGANNF